MCYFVIISRYHLLISRLENIRYCFYRYRYRLTLIVCTRLAGAHFLSFELIHREKERLKSRTLSGINELKQIRICPVFFGNNDHA